MIMFPWHPTGMHVVQSEFSSDLIKVCASSIGWSGLGMPVAWEAQQILRHITQFYRYFVCAACLLVVYQVGIP